METDDVFSDQMQVCRPEFVELFCAFAIAVVADSCDVVCEGVKPYIYNMFRVKVYRDSPFEGCSGHTEILKTRKKEVVHHLVFTRLRLDEIRMCVDVVDQFVCILAHFEEICLFFSRYTWTSAVRNAGEVSITILVEIVSWYYPETKALTIYSQDSDTYDFQRKAEADLRKIFAMRMPVPVSYKSNDAILCQLVREGKISINNLDDYRKDVRKITYSKEQDDHANILVTELVDNKLFAQLVSDKTVHIIF